jgi:hypothetical protein
MKTGRTADEQPAPTAVVRASRPPAGSYVGRQPRDAVAPNAVTPPTKLNTGGPTSRLDRESTGALTVRMTRMPSDTSGRADITGRRRLCGGSLEERLRPLEDLPNGAAS